MKDIQMGLSADAMGHRIRRLARRMGLVAEKWRNRWYAGSPQAIKLRWIGFGDEMAFTYLVRRLAKQSKEHLAWAERQNERISIIQNARDLGVSK